MSVMSKVKSKIKSKIQAARDKYHMMQLDDSEKLNVLSIDETINKIVDEKLSVSRYGDGELLMIANQMNESFQTYDKEMAEKLKRVIDCPIENHLSCIPGIFNGFDKFNDNAKEWYEYFMSRKKYLWYKYFDVKVNYGNAFITRCYIDLKDKSPSQGYFKNLKRIWHDRDVVFIEGEFSRLGVGNDLFDNARSIRRILAPAKNAYTHYDEILAAADKLNKDCLILLALGATATCLAYDLCKLGFQAVDIGHADVEYMWMLMGAESKVPIPQKYVNEAGDEGHKEETLDDKKYLSEIIARIGTKFN